MPGHSGRLGGKLYLASVAARAAAAQRIEDRTNVLLAQTNKTQPSTPSNREIRYQHRSDEKSQGDDASSKMPTAMEGEKIIFEKLTPVAESSGKSSPQVVVASPALQQTSVVELPAMQQLPCVQLNTQPPSVEKSPRQDLSTPAGDDDYVQQRSEEEVDLHLPSDDLNEDEMAPLCAARQLCCDPNSDTDDYRFCMNCNFEAHTICTEQMNFQTPAPDQLIIPHWDFSYGGKERYKKHPVLIALILYFVFSVKHE